MAEAIYTFVGRGAAPVTPAGVVGAGAVSGVSGEPSALPRGPIPVRDVEDLSKIYQGSSEDESEGGNVSHDSSDWVGGPNRWYFCKDWQPFWDANCKIAGFVMGDKVVPGSIKFSDINTGLRWRYSQARPLASLEAVSSERFRHSVLSRPLVTC